jgi:TolB-like protein/tRNA A-37 threonylcarbamoyl transferase component Bud32
METMADSQNLVENLFEAALAKPPDERGAFLDSACPNSPEVRQLVKMLLLADERAGDFLETPLLSSSDTSAQEPTPTYEPETTVAGRFQIHRFIARGGMGEVYEAWDSQLRERVAIKTIRPDLAQSDAVIERFRREVKQARAISHPNVCRIHELFCDVSPSGANVWFLSMEFLDGHTLSEHIRHNGPIKPALAFDLLEQIVSGLNAAHANGVIHRDLKTSNIMLVSGSLGNLRAVITDFGLATNVLRREGGLSETGGQGTPEFMAPEQRTSAEVTTLADEYALGVILCSMLTGSHPTQEEVVSNRAQLQARLAKTSDPRWARVILRCLEQKPADRFDKLEDVVVTLKPSPRNWKWPAVAAALIFLIALGLWYRSRPTPPPTSLAVLPLVNRTGDANLDYVGAGITEALTNDLARIPGLQVAAGTVARRFLGPQVNPTSAGKEMHVGTVLSGAFEKSGDELRVPVEVIDVRTGQQLWGKTYEAKSKDLVDLQHQISTDVAYGLKIHIDPDTTARLKRQYSTNVDTYNAYLKARFEMAKRSPDALREAIVDFQRALNSDPHYAPAYAGLADCYSLLAFNGLEKPKPILQAAISAAQQALELDSTLGEAYSSRALARTFLNFDWEGAEDDYKRAIELNPTYLQARTSYALLLLAPQGRLAEARAQMAYVQAADPNSFLTIGGQAMIEQYAGNFDKSIQILQPHMHELDQLESPVQIMAVDYIAKHDAQKAIEILRVPPNVELRYSRQAVLAAAYAFAGERSKAQEMAKQVDLHLRQGEPIAYDAALLYTALDDPQKALDRLDYAFDSREPDIIWANVDPMLLSLRSDPRFHNLITKINLQ